MSALVPSSSPLNRNRYPISTALALAVLLAAAVVGFEQSVHARLLGLRGDLPDILAATVLDAVLALPLAWAVVWAGHWLARRRGWSEPTSTAAAVSGLFAVFFVPAALVGSPVSADHAMAQAIGAPGGAVGVLRHALFDATLAWLAGFLVLVVPLAAWWPAPAVSLSGRPRFAAMLGRRAAAVWVLVAASGLLVLALTPGTGAAASQTRTYYIAAEEVDWDYAPSGINQITGQPFGEQENVFVQVGRDRIGKIYRKALYREYTDATFTSRKPVPPEWQHLGTLGPAIRAEVGDTIRVVFKNQTRFPASIHPHGVFYLKNSEGAPYNDGTSAADKADDAVPAGGIHTYLWSVPERAGPGPNDPSSILWMYHSHMDEPGDTNAGLLGPIIITRAGRAKADASPIDVDREFITLFTVFDENRSPYLDYNIRTYTRVPTSVRKDSEEFKESNLMHSINGYVYGNLPAASLSMKSGERVRWYVLGMGTEVDLHTPHWHGQTLLMMGMRTDVAELLPGSMKVLDMVPDDPGTWLYHCHVNDHIDAGMLARFVVQP